jgi:hypothetical protein
LIEIYCEEVPMSVVSLEEMQQDRVVMSVARALALANETALAQGKDPADSLITITEQGTDVARVWRINYGARDYVNRRGGDLIIIVDERSQSIEQIIRSQ